MIINLFLCYIIINSFKIIFQFLEACLKQTPSDFQIKQKWLLYKNKALSLSVTNLGKTLISSKSPRLKLYALQNG